MSLYRYRALDAEGRTVRGESDALNSDELESRLGRLGLSLLMAQPVKPGLAASLSRRKIDRRALIDFFFHMDSLLRAGVPLVDTLTDLRDSSDLPAMRSLVGDLVDRIETGSPFSEALAGHPEVFSKLLIGLVRTGEITGNLPDVLRETTANLKWQDELSSQTRKALMYPTFVAVVVLSVVFFLMIYLVPQLVQFLANMKQDMPIQTRVLIAVSNFIVNWWALIIALPVVAGVALKVGLDRSAELRRKRDHLLLEVPVLGPILRKIALARFANTFALMYGSGIPVMDALLHCEEATGNIAVTEAMQRARNLIGQGIPISQAFEASAAFPPLVLRMLKVGEHTGRLDEALRNVSYFYSRDVNEGIGKLQSMIEPILTVVMGGLLGWIMLAVLGPVYDTIANLPM